MLISLVICTYNRADILKFTLPSYGVLRIPSNINLEIVIVNNNSIDETESFAKEYIKNNKSAISYLYVDEPKQGLSHARNRGYEKASGEYIAYLDDECILPDEWLEVAMQSIRSDYPAFLGGPYYGKYLPGSFSDWYKESFGDSYILRFNLPDGPMQKGRYLSGGNLLIRRDVFDKIGLFDTELGMCGDTINYGEEQDFQKRLIAHYPEEIILSNSKLYVWHYIRNEKMSLSYMFNEALIRGKSSAKSKKSSLLRLVISPLLLILFSVRALLSFTWKFAKSLFCNTHFYTFLHDDYKRSVWRDVGREMYYSKLLIKYFTRGGGNNLDK